MTPLRYFDSFTCVGPRQRAHPAAPYALDHLLEEMEHCSIDGALVADTASLRYDPMWANRGLSDRLAEHPGLFALWHVFPHHTGEMPEPEALFAEMRERGAANAALIAPATACWNPLSATSDALLAYLAEHRILTVVAAPTELPFAEVEQILQRYPTLPLLLRNVSWSHQRTVLPMLLRYDNLYIGFDTFQINRGIEWLVERGCEDQLLYLSNAPDMSMGAHRLYVDYAEVSQDARAKIAGGNLTRLLKGQVPGVTRENSNEDPVMAQARRAEPLSVPVYDAHAHILDKGLDGAGGAFTMFEGDPEGVRRLGRRLGVDGIGVMSWNGIMVPDPDDGNRCVQCAIDFDREYFWGLGTFDVIRDSPETQHEKMREVFAEQRFLGLKPYPTFGFHYDDPRYEAWWEFANAHGLYAGLHPNRLDLSEFDKLCQNYPNATFVAFHCGRDYWTADHAIEKAQRYSNFMAEITLTPVCSGIIDYLVAGCGAERVLYGSDLPMRDPRQQLGWVVYSKLPLDKKKLVLGGNARRLIDKVSKARRSEPKLSPAAMLKRVDIRGVRHSEKHPSST
jgi:predicted TIM-barrel fold metal-dependent hydrolase